MSKYNAGHNEGGDVRSHICPASSHGLWVQIMLTECCGERGQMQFKSLSPGATGYQGGSDTENVVGLIC